MNFFSTHRFRGADPLNQALSKGPVPPLVYASKGNSYYKREPEPASAEVQHRAQLPEAAFLQGSSTHYFLDIWLLFQGIKGRKVQHIYLPPDEMRPTSQLKHVDAVAIWEPLASLQWSCWAMMLSCCPIHRSTPNTLTW